jgi:hypothetical protein
MAVKWPTILSTATPPQREVSTRQTNRGLVRRTIKPALGQLPDSVREVDWFALPTSQR